MAPALRALSDGQTRTAKEIRELVAREMGITEEDREERISSGLPVFDNRVGWAVTYMVQAGLVRRPKRAVNQITAPWTYGAPRASRSRRQPRTHAVRRVPGLQEPHEGRNWRLEAVRLRAWEPP